MTNQTQNQPAAGNGDGEANKPTHVAKVRHGTGKKASWERIGVAWEGENGSVYVRLYGTQIVSEGFSLYPIDDQGGAR